MFENFIYFIVVLLIFTTYQTPEDIFPDGPTSFSLSVFLIFLFALFSYKKFRSISHLINKKDYSNLDHQFTTTLTRLSIFAIILFAVDIYLFNLPSYFYAVGIFKAFPTLNALLFIGLFIGYLIIIWSAAHKTYQRLNHTSISIKTYIGSNLSISLPILLPWLLLSLVFDIINILPFENLKIFMGTTLGEISYFLIFLLIVILFGPLIIQKFWRCTPLESGVERDRIESLCKRAKISFAEILYWPIFGGRMITAGVMGVQKKFRFLLITKAMLNYLNPVEIDAVIAHEIGHVKKKHLQLYLIFFGGYMLLSYLVLDYILYLFIFSTPVYNLINSSGLNLSTAVSILMSLIIITLFILYFRYIFGYFMRNFERQADTYVYTFFNTAAPLINAFNKIAAGSGQPSDKPNWHHFSIQERISFLEKCEHDRSWIKKQDQKIKKSIGVYLFAICIIGGIGFYMNAGKSGKMINFQLLEKVLVREIEKAPDSSNLYEVLGDLYIDKKKYRDAINNYETALKISPNNPHILNNLAWILATCEITALQNPIKALSLAKKAAALQIDSPHILDTLAECYFVNGKYSQAVDAEIKALEMTNKNEDKDYFKSQLQKYKNAEKNR